MAEGNGGLELVDELGPLANLQGTWEGNEGLDVAYSNEKGEVGDTPYREKASFSPFGPVTNGVQVLYGLDYRTSAWKEGQENPFHTEVGYWLWDAANEQVMRCFMVPRATLILAGGSAKAGDSTFSMSATLGSPTYGILSNQFLDKAAKTVSYELTVKLEGGTFFYEEIIFMEHARIKDQVPFHHTDKNLLHRVS